MSNDLMKFKDILTGIITKAGPDKTDFLNAVVEIVEKNHPDFELNRHPSIAKINELCIQEHAFDQALNVYQNYPKCAFKDQAIKDFVSMEHERRKNDLSRFGLCAWQQVEAILNLLFNDELCNRIQETKDDFFFHYSRGYGENRTETRADRGRTVERYLIWNERPNAFDGKEAILRWDTAEKLRAIVYYVCFEEKVFINEQESFNSINEWLRRIYAIRNTVHRGDRRTSKYLKLGDKDVFSLRGKVYCMACYFLVMFIELTESEVARRLTRL